MKRIEDASGESLLPFVEECIEPGSVVHTDGWPGDSGLKKEGYVHQVTVVSRQEQSASELMPRVHRVMSPELCTDSLCECGCVRSGLAVVVRW